MIIDNYEISFHVFKYNTFLISDMSLEINLSRLSVGPIPNFTVLHVDEEEFESEGVFWGTKVDSKHFKYVADDLGKEITQYCKSSKDTEYHPEIGEFCLAVYEGLISQDWKIA